MHRLGLALPVLLSACTGDETVSAYAPGAVYRLEALDGAPFAAEATIAFPVKGEVAGSGPCNRYTARQAVPYPWIEIGPIAATRRACPALAAETRFFAALRAMTLAEALGEVLILSNDAGDQMVFRAVQPVRE